MAKEIKDYKILIIEDNEMLVDIIQELLEGIGFKVLRAINGKQGFEVFEEHDADLILLDIMMPQYNGFWFLEKVREKFPDKNVPIIMLTALGQKEYILKALKFGAVDYIVKPVKWRALLQKIKNILKVELDIDSILGEHEKTVSAEAMPPETLTKVDLKNITILVVEGEDGTRETIHKYLSDIGFNVISVDDGLKGFIKTKEDLPDLIIFDINAQRYDGFRFLEKLEDELGDKNLPVIITSDSGNFDNLKKAIKMGAADYILRPIKLKTLKEKISSILNVNLPEDKTTELNVHFSKSTTAITINIVGYLSKEGIDEFKQTISAHLNTAIKTFKKVVFNLKNVQPESVNEDNLNNLFQFQNLFKEIGEDKLFIIAIQDSVIEKLKNHNITKNIKIVYDELMVT